MVILFGGIAGHAVGRVTITIPWQSLDPVLKPGMRTTLETVAK